MSLVTAKLPSIFIIFDLCCLWYFKIIFSSSRHFILLIYLIYCSHGLLFFILFITVPNIMYTMFTLMTRILTQPSFGTEFLRNSLLSFQFSHFLLVCFSAVLNFLFLIIIISASTLLFLIDAMIKLQPLNNFSPNS